MCKYHGLELDWSSTIFLMATRDSSRIRLSIEEEFRKQPGGEWNIRNLPQYFGLWEGLQLPRDPFPGLRRHWRKPACSTARRNYIKCAKSKSTIIRSAVPGESKVRGGSWQDASIPKRPAGSMPAGLLRCSVDIWSGKSFKTPGSYQGVQEPQMGRSRRFGRGHASAAFLALHGKPILKIANQAFSCVFRVDVIKAVDGGVIDAARRDMGHIVRRRSAPRRRR